MKRSEKIEIRLSHEEKTALTDLAEKEGRTVSKLVRDVVSKYMDLNTANLPPRWNRWKITALTAAATLFGFGLSNALSMANHSEKFVLHGFIEGEQFNTVLNRKSTKPVYIDVKTYEAEYRIEVKFVTKDDFHYLLLKTCKVMSDGCELFSEDDLIAHSDEKTLISKSFKTGKWSFDLTGPYYKKPNGSG